MITEVHHCSRLFAVASRRPLPLWRNKHVTSRSAAGRPPPTHRKMFGMITNRHGRPFLFCLFSILLASALLGSDSGSPSGGSPLDGSWQVWYEKGQSKSYEMEIANGTFHAVDGEQWYKGEILLDEQAVPARIEFTIRECDRGFLDNSSTGIFRWDGDVLEIRAPAPGDPRQAERERSWAGSIQVRPSFRHRRSIPVTATLLRFPQEPRTDSGSRCPLSEAIREPVPVCALSDTTSPAGSHWPRSCR